MLGCIQRCFGCGSKGYKDVDATVPEPEEIAEPTISEPATMHELTEISERKAISESVEIRKPTEISVREKVPQAGPEDLSEDFALDAVGADGMTLLMHAAVLRQDRAALKELLSLNANPAVAGERGNTPLHVAAVNGNTMAVADLLDCGAPINARNEDGRTALHVAAAAGHTQVVYAILQKKPDLDALDGEGNTAVTLARAIGANGAVRAMEAFAKLAATHAAAQARIAQQAILDRQRPASSIVP
jgi:ankyrin repeat protein